MAFLYRARERATSRGVEGSELELQSVTTESREDNLTSLLRSLDSRLNQRASTLTQAGYASGT